MFYFITSAQGVLLSCRSWCEDRFLEFPAGGHSQGVLGPTSLFFGRLRMDRAQEAIEEELGPLDANAMLDVSDEENTAVDLGSWVW